MKETIKCLKCLYPIYKGDSHDLLLSETPLNTYDVQKNQPMCDKNKYPFKTNVLNTNKYFKDENENMIYK